MDSGCLVSLVQDGSDDVMKLGMFLWQHLVESLPQRIKAVLKAKGCASEVCLCLFMTVIESAECYSF